MPARPTRPTWVISKRRVACPAEATSGWLSRAVSWLLRECLDAGLQRGGELPAVAGGERGEHLFLDCVGRAVAGTQHRMAGLGQVRLQDARVSGVRVTGHPSLLLEFAQYLVHGLGRDERPARKAGIGQPWLLVEGGENGVLRERGAMLAQRVGHPRVQRGLGSLELVPGAVRGAGWRNGGGQAFLSFAVSGDLI